MEIRSDNYDVGTLENRVEIEVKDAQTSIQNLISSLNQLSTALNGSIGATSNNKLKENADNATKMINAFKKTFNLGASYLALKKGLGVAKDLISANIDMIETNNLFEVAMGKVVDEYGNLDEASSKYYIQAMKFQDEMNDKLATNKSEMKQYQAMYFSMLKSQGINLDDTYKMSESLTKAGYDIASLYNLDVDDAMKKLQSGLAGQVKSLRDIGIDISESSLQKVLDERGIERSVQQLTYAEKEVARYLAIMKQAGQAQGDFAKTFEQPANQIRVFKNQLIELKQVAGSFATSLFGNIIVYANAIIMTIKEILKAFATLLGYDLETGGSSNLSDTLGIGDVSSDLGNATKKAKEFKKQLMGFDEINNITLPSSSGSGSGGRASNGIDSRLLANLTEWDNKMNSISGKAQEIRDKMLEWLGFERDDNGGWKLGEGLTNFKKILDVVKIIGATILGWKISNTITRFLSNLGVLNKTKAFTLATGMTLTITGIIAQFMGTQHLLKGDIDIFTLIETFLGTGAGAFGIATILKNLKMGKGMTKLQRLEFGLGVMLAIQSIQVIADGINNDDIVKEAIGALEAGAASFSIAKSFGAGSALSLKFAAGVSLIVTGVTIIAQEGKWADKYFDKYKEELYSNKEKLSLWETINVSSKGVGEGATKWVTDLTSKITEWAGITKLSREELNKMTEEVNKAKSSYKEFKENLDKTVESNKAEISLCKTLSDELNTLVDANGKVKEGYEGRVDFILKELNNSFDMELTRDGQIISKNGEVINSNKELQDAINKTIEVRKKEIEQEVAQELYKEALKARITAQNQLTKAIQNQKQAYEEMQKITQERPWDKGSIAVATSNYQIATNAVNDLRDQLLECNEDVELANKNLTGSMVETSGVITQEMIKEEQITTETLSKIAKENADVWEKNYNKLDSDTKKAMLGMSTTIKDNSPIIIKKWAELSRGSYKEFETYMDYTDQEAMSTILSILTNTEGMTPNIEKAWTTLSERSSDAFNKGIKDLPDDTKGKLLANIIAVDGMNDSTKKAYFNLSDNAKNAFNNAMNGMDTDTRNKVQSAINEINNQRNNAYNVSYNVGEEARKGADAGSNSNGGSKQIGKWFVSGFLSSLTSDEASKGAFNAGWQLIKRALKGGNEAQKTGSPAKETIKMGNFFTEGYIIGLQKKTREVKKVSSGLVGTALAELNKLDINSNIEQLSNGIQVSAKDTSIDATSYVNYGAISGNISANSSLSVNSNIIQGIAEAVGQAMKQTELNVNIEARAEEGVIVKKASQGFKDYVMQTGELPFPVPIG